MTSFLAPPRSAAFQTLRLIARTSPTTLHRALSTLPNNPHIYIHPDTTAPSSKPSYILSYLPTSPLHPSLSIGRSTHCPPTPDSFTANPDFLALLHTVLAEHAAADPDVRAQAQVYVSSAGSALGSGGAFFPSAQYKRRAGKGLGGGGGGGGGGGDGAGGASAQGGMGGGGRGGYIHVSDTRNPPDYGRVAWPEDIFGSLEIDAQGRFVDGNGRYQAAGTYRVVTREGVLGLSEFLRGKVVERLRELEGKMGGKAG